jgi:hypothetical protein
MAAPTKGKAEERARVAFAYLELLAAARTILDSLAWE